MLSNFRFAETKVTVASLFGRRTTAGHSGCVSEMNDVLDFRGL